MKKLVSLIFTSSLLFGGFCPIPMASAMQPSEEVLMSPYISMTLAAPMSVAAISYHVFLPIELASGGCSGENCNMMDYSKKQVSVASAASGYIQGGTALLAAIPSFTDLLSLSSPPPLLTDGSYLANTLATIVLRV